MKSPITTHILDTAKGRPAAGVKVDLQVDKAGQWTAVGAGVTDEDGRVTTLMQAGTLVAGRYRISFDTGSYNPDGFYPAVSIVFVVKDPTEHYHVPLLLNPFGYSTYRGS